MASKNAQLLTARQERFVAEYLVDLNGKQAAIRAGYRAKTAEFQASRLLRNVKVQAAITRAKAARAKRTHITADRVLRELASVAFSDVGQVLDFSGKKPRLRLARAIPQAARRALRSIKVKRYLEGTGAAAREVEVTELRFWDKNAALEKLGRHLHLFNERPNPNQTAVNVQVNVNNEQPNPICEAERLARAVALLDAARARIANGTPPAADDAVLPAPAPTEAIAIPEP
jgi:phage terminase small subunit